VDRSGNFIASNNYKTGKVMIWKLKDGVYRGKTVQELLLEPKVHGANFSADNRWLLVPATGPNKVFVNQFDQKTGTLKPNQPAFGSGPREEGQARHPRHLLFHPTMQNILYTTNENDEPGVCVWRWDTTQGMLNPIQNIVTKPNIDGKFSTATLRMSPNSKFLFVSNRDRGGKSSISSLKIDPGSGKLSLVGRTPCENVPRSFCLDGSGKFAFVAGQTDNRLGVYSINQSTGQLIKIQQHEVGKRPSWVEVR
jgi:6-phosphogluconolactonase